MRGGAGSVPSVRLPEPLLDWKQSDRRTNARDLRDDLVVAALGTNGNCGGDLVHASTGQIGGKPRKKAGAGACTGNVASVLTKPLLFSSIGSAGSQVDRFQTVPMGIPGAPVPDALEGAIVTTSATGLPLAP